MRDWGRIHKALAPGVKFAVRVNSGGATHILQSQMCTFQCFSSIEIHLKNQMLEREREGGCYKEEMKRFRSLS